MIGPIFTAIKAQGRQPDLWERASLGNAIDMLSRGAYTDALRFADVAMTPPTKRSPRDLSFDPRLDRLGINTLQAAFDDACAQPLRAEPHFGPVVFQAQPED